MDQVESWNAEGRQIVISTCGVGESSKGGGWESRTFQSLNLIRIGLSFTAVARGPVRTRGARRVVARTPLARILVARALVARTELSAAHSTARPHTELPAHSCRPTLAARRLLVRTQVAHTLVGDSTTHQSPAGPRTPVDDSTAHQSLAPFSSAHNPPDAFWQGGSWNCGVQKSYMPGLMVAFGNLLLSGGEGHDHDPGDARHGGA